eukprot:3521704-Rhodomonas_salina.1
MVCADGLIFDKNDLGISEAMLTGESVLKRKGKFVLGDNDEAAVKVSPALFAGTFVQEGEGRMLVVAVGGNTYQVRPRPDVSSVVGALALLFASSSSFERGRGGLTWARLQRVAGCELRGGGPCGVRDKRRHRHRHRHRHRAETWGCGWVAGSDGGEDEGGRGGEVRASAEA